MYIRKIAQTPELQATVIDNLESESNVDALSAKQGKILNEKVDTIAEIPVDTVIAYDGEEIPEGYEEIEYDDIKVSPTQPSTGERVWIQKGKNLFDKNKICKGYELNGDTGTDVLNAEWYITDYIRVTPGLVYYLSGNKTRGSSNFFYDKNKNGIKSVPSVTGAIIAPDNAYYVRFNGLLTELENNIQLEQNNVETSYEAYIDKKVYIKSANGGYEEFINVENIPTVKQINLHELFISLNYTITDFLAYQYGNIVNIQRMVINNVGKITAETIIGELNPKYNPKGGLSIRTMGSSGGAIFDFICFLKTHLAVYREWNAATAEGASVYVFNTSYMIN